MYAMDRLHDREAHYLAEAKRADVYEPRQIAVVGDGNVEQFSIAKLLHLKALIAVAISDYLGVDDSSVYVIGTKNPSCVKIGKADSPIARLASLQTGNPEELYIYRVFWVRDMETAQSIEAYAHRRAGSRYTRFKGEWFGCTPSQAHAIIERAIDDQGIDYCVMTPCNPEMAQ